MNGTERHDGTLSGLSELSTSLEWLTKYWINAANTERSEDLKVIWRVRGQTYGECLDKINALINGRTQ